MADTNDSQWHLDKRVPVALIAMIVLQTASIAWWGSNISARVDKLEQVSASRSPLVERVARQEALMENVQSTTQRIESKLDRLIDQQHQ